MVYKIEVCMAVRDGGGGGGGVMSQYGVCKCVFVDRVSILSVYMMHYSQGGH